MIPNQFRFVMRNILRDRSLKTLFTVLCFLCIVFSCPGGVAYTFYRSGNANGIPVLSMDDKAKSGIYLNGNCNGVPAWSIQAPWNEQKIAELFFVLLSLGYFED